MRSVWAMSLMMLFVFGSSLVFGQSSMVQRSVELNLCYDDRPDPTLTQEDLEFIFAGNCAGSELTFTISEDLQGDDCGWQVIYSYNITCGDESFSYKEIFIGRDQSAPELEGELPAGGSELNLCFDEIPAGPSEMDIAALFSDNCNSVIVTKSGEPEGDDCEWTVSYVYDVRDACDNVYLGDVKVEYSGGDSEAPQLGKNAVIPTGEKGLNLCFADKSQGPSEEEIAALFGDNCGNVNVTKIPSSKGTDCKWKATYVYQIEDDCGNRAEDIVIEYTGGDMEAPELEGVPADTTVDCIDELPPVAQVTATDNCASKPKVTYEEDLSGLGLACEGGVVVRTWTVEDDCLNSSSMSQTITVTPAPKAEFEEAEPLEISCEEVEGFEAPGLGYSNGVEEGACAINGVAEGLFDAFQDDCGSFVISYSFTDECGYTITADRTVTVFDNKAPELTVPGDETVECDDLPEVGEATASDNCDDDVTITYDGEERTDGECLDSYTLTRTWTASDNCGNSTTLSQTITVQDTTAPELTIPADVTVECDAVPMLDEGAASATDNCDEDVLIEFIDEKREDGECLDSYTLIRIWRATDNCGNQTVESQMITVQDTTAPELTVPGDVTVECDAVPMLDEGAASATDNCDAEVQIDFVDEKREDGDCPYNYTLTRTWKATDNCGNETMESQVITVQDTMAPELTVPADLENVECSEVPEPGVASAEDNCDSAPVVTYEGEERTDGECLDSYTLVRTWKAVDSCGNMSTASQTITVVDTTAPEVTAPADETVECDEVPQTPEVGSVSGASATDNCDMDVKVEFLKEERIDGDCPNNYQLVRIWLGTDNCGNTATASQVITVQDTKAPTFTAPEDITIYTDEECNYDASINITGDVSDEADNCTEDLEATYSDSIADGQCEGEKIITRTWSLVDECDNEAEPQVQIITIKDNIKPTFTAPEDITIYSDSKCEYDASVEFTGDVEDENDNCTMELEATYSDSVADGTCEGEKIITRTWSLVDDCGNAADDQVQIITVKDNIVPTFTAPADITIYTDEECNYDASVEATGDVIDEDDNCTDKPEATYSDSIAEGQCEGEKIITRTWTLKDDCDNEAEPQVQIITVKDNIKPTFTRPADTTIYTDENCEYDASVSETGDVEDENDNCTMELEATYSDSVADGTCEGEKIITRTWSLVDDCGNAADDQVQIITVKDNIAPTFKRPADITIDCSDPQDPSFTGDASEEDDNCTMVLDATYSDNVVEGICPGNYTIERTWSLVDDCGNEADDQVQIITVQDTTPPYLSGDPLPEYFNGINDCKPEDLLAYGLSEAEVAAYFKDDCSNVVVTKSVKSQVGDDCGWGIIFSYLVADDCGNELGEFKIAYAGSDEDAPVLVNPDSPLLDGTSGWQCKSEVPAAPKMEELMELYTEDCSVVNISEVERTESLSNCDWYVTYTFQVWDDCGNYADPIVITHTGMDTTPPELVEPLPYDTHINGIDGCAGDDLGEPSAEEVASYYADNCGGEVTVHKEVTLQSGGDCGPDGWQVWVRYTAKDECGNEAASFKIIYQGYDMSGPVKGDCQEPPMKLYTEGGADCPADATIALNVGDYLDLDNLFTVAGIDLGANPNNFIPTCYTDNCTAVEDLKYRVTEVNNSVDGSSDCVAILSMTFVAEDACGNDSPESFTCEFIVYDNTAPEVSIDGAECGDVIDLGELTEDQLDGNGIPNDIPTKATWVDNCQGNGETADYSDAPYFTTLPGVEGFVGDFAPANWAIDGTAGGSVSINATTLVVTGDPDGGFSQALATCPVNGNYSFDWDWFTNDDFAGSVEWDPAFYVNGELIQLSDDDGPVNQNGQVSVNCVAGDVIGFYIEGDGFGSSELTITNFSVAEVDVELGITRTFTKDDGCGNVGSCSVSYTWTVAPEGDIDCGDVVFGDTSDQGPEDILVDETPGYFDFEATGNVYTFIGTGDFVEVSTCENTDFDTLVAVYDTNGLVDFGDDTCGTLFGPGVTGFFSVEGEVYEIVVKGYGSQDVGSYQLSIKCFDPTIARQGEYVELGGAHKNATSARVVEDEKVEFKAYPVPFKDNVTISYMFEYDTNVTVELFDAKGILVSSATNSRYVKGSKDSTNFDMTRLSNQMYYVKVTTSRGSMTKKIVSGN